jgi:hypothetical protein
MATKTAPKAKAKPKVKAKLAAKPKSAAKPKLKAKAPVKAKTVVKAVAKKAIRQTEPPPKHESVFARLLREKAERHEALQRQKESAHHANDQRMPHNHASYSKFAGPRRRAS